MPEPSSERKQLLSELDRYVPFNEQEENDLPVLISAINGIADVYFRTSVLCHMTASAWVVNPNRSKVLMAFHNIYKSWSWLGGHADGDEDLLQVAIREVQEESGIQQVSPVQKEIYSFEILTVDGHEKRGIYVPSHLHLNITYLLEADDTQILHHREGENTDVSWFSLQEAVEKSSEPWFRERIYKKLNAKLACFSKAAD